MSLFISNAYAQDAGGSAGGGFEMLIMLGVFGLIFYFGIFSKRIYIFMYYIFHNIIVLIIKRISNKNNKNNKGNY
jgi:hypothetical protein